MRSTASLLSGHGHGHGAAQADRRRKNGERIRAFKQQLNLGKIEKLSSEVSTDAYEPESLGGS